MDSHPSDPHWPHILNKEFQKLVNRKYELQRASDNTMAKLEMSSKEKINNGFKVSSFIPIAEQLYGSVLISPKTPMNSMIMNWDTGTGKTKASILIAENFKKSKINKCIIVAKNKAIDHWRQEIMSNCTKDEYVTQAERSLLDLPIGQIDKDLRNVRDVIQEKINARIHKYYSVIGHTKFTNETVGKRIRTDDGKLQMKLTNETVSYMRKDGKVNTLENVVLIIDEAHHIMGQDKYDAIFSLLKNCHNVKLILLTATCMYNEPQDLAKLLNLCLLVDKLPLLPIGNAFMQKLFGNSFGKYMTHCKRTFFMKLLEEFGNEEALKQHLNEEMENSELIQTLQQYIQIYMTTMRKEDENEFPIENIRTITCRMSKFQSNVYMKYFKEDVKQESLYTNARIASIAVAPDKSIGRSFNDRYFQMNQCGDIVLKSQRYKSYFDYASGNIKNYSCKVYECVKYILSTMFKKTNDGKFKHNANGIVYSEIKRGSIDVLIAALKSVNFNMFNAEKYFDNRDKKQRRNKNCMGTYLIITGDTKSDIHLSRALELFNSKENADGSIITLIIGTEAMRESIDLKRVHSIMIFSKWWNPSRDTQLIGRGSRRNSHQDVEYGLNIVYFISYPMVLNPEMNSIDHVVEIHSKWKKYMHDLVEPIILENSINNKDVIIESKLNHEKDMSSYTDLSMLCDHVNTFNEKNMNKNIHMIILSELTKKFTQYCAININDFFSYIISQYAPEDEEHMQCLLVTVMHYIMSNKEIISGIDNITESWSRGHLICIGNYIMFSSYLSMHSSGIMLQEKLLHYDTFEKKKQPITKMRIHAENKHREKRKITTTNRNLGRKRLTTTSGRIIPNSDSLVYLGHGYRATYDEEKEVFRILRPDNIRYNKNLTTINKNSTNSGMNINSFTFKQLFDMCVLFEIPFENGLLDTNNADIDKRYEVSCTGKVWTKEYLIRHIKQFYKQQKQQEEDEETEKKKKDKNKKN